MSFCLHSIQNIQHIIWNECYWVTACYSQMIPLVPRNSMSQWCLFIYLFFSRNTLLEPTCDSWKHAWINKCYFDHPLSRWWISWGREMGFVQQHLDAWLRAPLVLGGLRPLSIISLESKQMLFAGFWRRLCVGWGSLLINRLGNLRYCLLN